MVSVDDGTFNENELTDALNELVEKLNANKYEFE